MKSEPTEYSSLLKEMEGIITSEVIENCVNNQKPWMPMILSLCLALGNAADAVEIMSVGFIMTEISSLTSFDKEILSAAVFIGMLVGGIVGGYFSDNIGRKKALLYSLGINATAGFLSAASPDVTYLVVLRVIGLGIGGQFLCCSRLVQKYFPLPRVDSTYQSLPHSGWSVLLYPHCVRG